MSWGRRDACAATAGRQVDRQRPSAPATELQVGGIKTSFLEAKGYGFIESADAHKEFGRDVFVHKAQMQLKATTRRYGSHWFVRMPFKGYSSIHSFIGKPDWWRRSLAVVRRMDADHDGVISVNEVDAWVKSDGIWVVEYNRQISARQRCEAAAALTFLLQYDERPTRVPKDNVLYRGYYHPLVQEAITRACGPAVQQVHG